LDTTQAINEICKIAFGKYDIVRIYADVFSTNIGSCKVLEKCGFKLEGKLKKSVFKNNQLLDSYLYAMVK